MIIGLGSDIVDVRRIARVIERHGGFDLETHERYRQMAARLKEHPTPAAST